MTNPEFSEGAFDDIDDEFQAIVSSKQMDHFGDEVIELLDTEKDTLIDCLLDHMSAYGAHEISDEDSVLDIQNDLTDLMMTDFDHLTRMNRMDEITVSGDTLIRVMGELEDGTCVQQDIVLSNEARIRGFILGPVVHDIPPIQEVERTKQQIMNPDEDIQDAQPLQAYPFGLSIGLKDAHYEDVNGTAYEIPEGFCVLAPLNYPGMKIGHIVKQEA